MIPDDLIPGFSPYLMVISHEFPQDSPTAHAICARWDATDLLPRLRQLEKQLQDAAAFAGLPFDREVGELKNSKNYQGLVNVFFFGGEF